MNDWTHFFDWASKGVISFVCTYGVHVLSKMHHSIVSLNQKMAKLLERTEWHSKELKKLDVRVTRIETENE